MAMASSENIHLPFRWQFAPLEEASDRSIRWKWRAYTQSGDLVMESTETYETLTECISDAKARGYGAP